MYSDIWNYDFSIWIPFNSVRCLSMNVIIMYVWCLSLIKHGFQFINQSLSILPELNVIKKPSIGVTRIRLNASEVNSRLNELFQLHLNLENVAKMINELFSLPMLIALLMQFSQSIANVYTIAIFINTKMYRSWKTTRRIFGITGWLGLRLILIFYVVDICNATCREANRKAIILHELWSTLKLKGNRETLKNISIRLLQKPLEINLYDSLNLNHQIFYKMCGLLITYLIIIIQIDKNQLRLILRSLRNVIETAISLGMREILKILPEVEIAHSVRKKVKTIRLSPHEVDIRLNELSQLHFDLKHLVKMFSELLSLPLLIALTMQLFHIILNTYMISIFINNGRHRSWRGIRGLTALTAFLLLRLIQLFSIVNVCDATCQEANRKAIILHEFWASRRPEGSKDRVNNVVT
ncbi:uncharacterized protein [Chelonus insularis]|uniref:uncharacterized protein n=1 Tax=Chelonus insularis TaxID=460826 RepID=UPI00158D4B46|nr:uncharacterized protein LOC118068315 [Chelonus insularis]